MQGNLLKIRRYMSFTLQFSSVTHSGVLNIIMYIFLRNTLKDWALTPVPADLETGFFSPTMT